MLVERLTHPRMPLSMCVRLEAVDPAVEGMQSVIRELASRRIGLHVSHTHTRKRPREASNIVTVGIHTYRQVFRSAMGHLTKESQSSCVPSKEQKSSRTNAAKYQNHIPSPQPAETDAPSMLIYKRLDQDCMGTISLLRTSCYMVLSISPFPF